MKRNQTENEVLEKETHNSDQRYFDNLAFEEESNYSIAGVNEDKPLVDKSWGKPERNLFTLILDAALFVVEYLQMFALLQSLSLRWPWPISWTGTFSFLFIFNLDVWELAKMATPNAYFPATNFLVESANVPIDYRVMMLCWLIVLLLAGVLFFILQRIYNNRLQYKSLYQLKTVSIISLQILALPIGVQIGKLFWCRQDGTLDIENTLVCWSAEHSIYVAIALVLVACLYLVYPAWLMWHISKQVITSDALKHEMYMRLKHCEHLYGLNTSWNEQLYFTFASFRRFWVYQRPIAHLVKFAILCFYAASFSNRLVQASAIFGILLVWLIVSLVRLPYRVSSYNFPHAWNLACLSSCAVIGALKSIDGLQNVFLLPDYMLGELILINCAWLVGILLWLLYLVLRLKTVVRRYVALWPALLKIGRNGVTENTQRYIVACTEAKKALDQANSVPALLSPVHVLAHHIKVLNALACEAEHIRDPFHSTLRDVLDDVIQLHNKLIGTSIFTESVKAFVQTTISRLIEMLPAFSKRLHQRDFDLILTPPPRRRMLLKMYAVSCFMEMGRGAGAHDAGVRKLWKSDSVGDLFLDEGFHDDDTNVIALKNINISTGRQDRPLSVRSSRKSDAVSLQKEESIA